MFICLIVALALIDDACAPTKQGPAPVKGADPVPAPAKTPSQPQTEPAKTVAQSKPDKGHEAKKDASLPVPASGEDPTPAKTVAQKPTDKGPDAEKDVASPALMQAHINGMIYSITKEAFEFLQKWAPQPTANSSAGDFVAVKEGKYTKVIGRGAQSEGVALFRHEPTKKVYAMKIVSCLKETEKGWGCAMSKFYNELNIMIAAQSKFLVPAHYYYWDKKACTGNLAMEYYRGGDAQNMVGWYTGPLGSIEKSHRLATVQFYAADMVAGLQYLHARNALHGDVKPSNYFVGDDGRWLLGDFGLSTWLLPNQKLTGAAGSANYMAPEVCENKSYTYTADLWSLGVTLYQIVAGRHLFPGYGVDSILRNVKTQKNIVMPDVIKEVSPNFENFLMRLLERDPEKRLGAKGPQEVSEHPFFDGLDWDKFRDQHSSIQVPNVPNFEGDKLTHYWSTFEKKEKKRLENQQIEFEELSSW